MVKICPECGAENPDDAVYCEQCYAKLEPLKNPVWREEVIPGKASKKSSDAGDATVDTQDSGSETQDSAVEPEKREVTKEEAVAALKEVKALIKDAKASGKDVSEAQKVFLEAKPALDSGDYNKVMEIADRVRQML